MKSRKISKMVAVLLCCTVLSAGAILADGHTDSYYSFRFTLFNPVQYTNAREKYEYTPLYLKLLSRSENQSFQASAVDSDGGDFSYSPEYRIDTVGKRYYISSNAYEDRGAGVLVRIKGRSNDWTGFRADVDWSPDSYR